MINNHSQKSGNSSTNIQAQQMVVHVGIDEKRAREICQELNLQLRKDYSQEALNVANARVIEFENRLMPKMAQVEGALEAFADPSFQLLLVEAQKTAASTERPVDYDLLSELLIHRFQKDENRIARAGISLAVEIVDKISDEALLGLTVKHALDSFLPVSGDIHEGLDILNDLFGKIFYSELPAGYAWLDHLDILKAVRLNPSGRPKKLQEYYSEHLHGYIDVGVNKNSENYDKAIEILKNNNLSSSILIEHALNSSFLRLGITSINDIDLLPFASQIVHEGKLIDCPAKLTEEQKKAISSIYNLYSKDNNIRQNNINSFMKEWENRPNLKTLREWWDNISTSFTVTSVGKVLAHSNAQRCDKNLPPFD
jgi:hypothetical protein